MTKDITTYDLEEILLTRQWFYDFLGKSFYMEPEIGQLKDVSNLNIFQQLKDENGNIESEGARLLTSFFNKVLSISEEEYKKLKEEYNILLVGPGHLPAPPWESVYLSKEGIIFDEHTLDVREFYKKWGVNTRKESKEPDDHIGFELEFMSILTGKGINALRENNKNQLKDIMIAQKEFLEEHTLLWIDEFSDKLLNNTEEDYFKGLSLFLLEFLKMDKELLVDLISNLDIIN